MKGFIKVTEQRTNKLICINTIHILYYRKHSITGTLICWDFGATDYDEAYLEVDETPDEMDALISFQAL